MVVRAFDKEDAAGVCGVHRAAVQRINSRDYTPKQIAAWLSRSTPEMWAEALDKTYSWVYDENTKVVGFGDLTLGGEVGRLYVHPDFGGRGIGTELLGAIELVARRKGMSEIVLDSTISAFSFYVRNGYDFVEKRTRKFAGEPLEALHMIKKL